MERIKKHSQASFAQKFLDDSLFDQISPWPHLRIASSIAKSIFVLSIKGILANCLKKTSSTWQVSEHKTGYHFNLSFVDFYYSIEIIHTDFDRLDWETTTSRFFFFVFAVKIHESIVECNCFSFSRCKIAVRSLMHTWHMSEQHHKYMLIIHFIGSFVCQMFALANITHQKCVRSMYSAVDWTAPYFIFFFCSLRLVHRTMRR